MYVMYYESMDACLEKCALIYCPLHQYYKISLISPLKDFFSKNQNFAWGKT
jgi:hypothetical protein